MYMAFYHTPEYAVEACRLFEQFKTDGTQMSFVSDSITWAIGWNMGSLVDMVKSILGSMQKVGLGNVNEYCNENCNEYCNENCSEYLRENCDEYLFAKNEFCVNYIMNYVWIMCEL